MSDQLVAEIATATYTTHKKQRQTNIHAFSRILTRDPSNQTAVDLRPRPHDYRNRPQYKYCTL